ncbi:hypothetical protein IJ182_00710 [bacterium]|nr:hypothetical protein [bacterium]
MINRISFGMTPTPTPKDEPMVTPTPTPYYAQHSNEYLADKQAEAMSEGGKYVYISPAGDQIDIHKAIKNELKNKYLNIYNGANPPEPTPIPEIF